MTAIHLNPVAVSSVALLRAIRAGGWSNQKELAQAAGRDPRNITRDLGIVRKAGLLADSETIALSDIGDLQLDAIERAEGRSDEPGLPASGMAATGILFLRHDQILPNPDNDRQDWDSEDALADLADLAEDIAERGLLQNLIVRPGPHGDDEPLYTLVGGERRWRAIGLLLESGRWSEDALIPVRLRQSDDLGHRLAALSENLKRRNLNPLEKAKAFDGLAEAFAALGVEDARINREIADRVGVTIEHVQQHRSLLKLDAADQERLALAKDDPRRLRVSEARKAVAAAAKADAEREALLAVPMDSRLALAEVLHAVSVQGRYSYDSIIIRPGAATTATGQDLVERGWLRFEGPLTYQWGHIDNLGHFAVARGQSVPSILGEPYWTGTPETREAALRATQAEAGHPDRTDYVTDWLNGPFDLTEEGQAIINEAADRAAAREQALADEAHQREQALAEQAAAAERQRVVAAQSRDLFAAHRNTPPPPQAVVDLAAAAEARLPWRLRFNGDVINADGELIIGGPAGGRASDRAEARMRLLVLAINTAGGVETPEDEPDPNPSLDREGFIAAMSAAASAHGHRLRVPSAVLDGFLSDNGAAFGDDGWSWTAEGAEALVVEHFAPNAADPDSHEPDTDDHEDAA